MTIHDVDKYSNYIRKFPPYVDCNVFFALMCMHKGDVKSLLDVKKHIFKYENKNIFDMKTIDKLIEDDFIKPTVANHEYMFSKLMVTDKFRSRVTVDKTEAFDELLIAYPEHVLIEKIGGNNKEWNAKAISREHGIALYAKKLKGDLLLHHKIVVIVEEYKKAFKYAPRTLEKFLEAEEWDYWEKSLKDKASNKDSIIKA